MGEKRLQYRTGLNSKYNQNMWRFITKEQAGGRGIGGWKISKRRHQVWGILLISGRVMGDPLGVVGMEFDQISGWGISLT